MKTLDLSRNRLQSVPPLLFQWLSWTDSNAPGKPGDVVRIGKGDKETEFRKVLKDYVTSWNTKPSDATGLSHDAAMVVDKLVKGMQIRELIGKTVTVMEELPTVRCYGFLCEVC